MKISGYVFFIILDIFFIYQVSYGQVNYEVFELAPADKTDGSFIDFCRDLSERQLIKGTFTLTKHDKSKNKKETEEGRFVLNGKEGVVLNNYLPDPFSVVIMEEGFVFTSKRNNLYRIRLGKNKTWMAVFSCFTSIFRGETGIILDNFDTYYHNSDGGWVLGLIPRDKTLRYFIDRFLIMGDSDIRNIYVIKKNGDILEYLLSGHSYPAVMTSEEMAVFSIK